MKQSLRERLLTKSGAKACVAMAGFAGLVAFGIATQGCQHVQTACAETASQRATAAVFIDDARARLEEAKAVVVRISNESIRAEALVALDAAKMALDASALGLAGAKDFCDSYDIKAAFADFILAWGKLAPFLSLLGGPSAGSQVQAPLVVSL